MEGLVGFAIPNFFFHLLMAWVNAFDCDSYYNFIIAYLLAIHAVLFLCSPLRSTCESLVKKENNFWSKQAESN